MSWVQYGKQALTFNPGNEDGFNQGDLKGYGQRGFADFFIKMDVEVDVTSGATVTGMTEAQAIEYLKTLTLDLRVDVDRLGKGSSKAQDPANMFHSLQALTFDDLRLMNIRLIEKDILLLTDTTTGLRQGFTAGTATVYFTMYASLGKVAFLKDWPELWGVGPDMLELLRLKVRAVSDGMNAYDSDLTTDEVRVTVKAYREKVKAGDRAFFLPMRRQYQPGDGKRAVSTHAGTVPLEVVDANAKLSTTLLEALTVEVGGQTVTDREDPTEIRSAYIANEDVASPETTSANYVTEVYVLPDTKLSALRAGEVTATQETYEVAWDARATLLPAPDEATVKRFIQQLSAQGLKAGQEFHFVNSASVAGKIDQVPATLLPAMGLTYFYATDAEAQDYPGLRCNANGAITLYLPPTMLAEAAVTYRQAMAEASAANPLGNVAKMDGALNRLGRHVPGYTEDEERGFPSSQPGGGTETGVYRTVRNQVRGALGLQ